jgi:hypothetical protein
MVDSPACANFAPKDTAMKRRPTYFLQAVIVLIGIGALAFLLWEPHVEGRNVHATTFDIYFKDPFLAYVYMGSIPFFVALYRTFGLFGDARRSGGFSQVTVDALQTIKKCALVLMGFVAGGIVFIIMFGDKDDRPPGIFMSLLVTLAASVIAIAASMCARKLQHALRRSEGSRGSLRLDG